MTRGPRWLLAAALGPLVGCLPYDPVERPAPPLDGPEAFTAGGEASGEEPEELRRGWWIGFGDPQLTELEGRMLSGSFQLHQAWARLEQARAAAELAGAPRWPQVGAELAASRQRQRLGSFGPQTFNAFGGSLAASYEVDLFGRIGAEATAAELDARATHLDVAALAMTLTAEVAETWYDLIALGEQRVLLEQQLETNGTFLELVQLRFQTGLASALDVYQQQQQVTAARARLALLDGQQVVLRNRLAVLVGEAPQRFGVEPPAELPELAPLPPVGVPLDLMQRRPDLRSAQLRVSAADYRVGAAIADWFPRINLRGSVGISSNELAGLFDIDSLVWSIAGAIAQTIIDGGRRSAEIERREGIVYERLAAYGQAFVTALAEVDNALAQEERQRLQIEELRSQVEISENTLREARARYREGLSDFLNVLQALSTLHQAQLNLLTAERQLISHRIQLVRALGGSWTYDLVPPERLEARESAEEDPE